MAALTWLNKFESNRVFTEGEGWALFRIAAITEAVGWTMLILGIMIEKLTGSHIPVTLAGRTHGMLFVLYMIAAVGLYPTLKWSRLKALVALAASTPPYGSLIFEQWAGQVRAHNDFRDYRICVVFAQIAKDS